MPNHHSLKCWPNYFNAIERGDKTFEVRRNDRDFQTGDVLELCEWDPNASNAPPERPFDPSTPPPAVPLPSAPGKFTGRSLKVTVSYCLFGDGLRFPMHGAIGEGFVVMGLRPCVDRQAEIRELMRKAYGGASDL